MLTQEKYEQRLEELVRKENESILRLKEYESKMKGQLSAAQEVVDNPPGIVPLNSGKWLSWMFVMSGIGYANQELFEILRNGYYGFSRIWLDLKAEYKGLRLRKVDEDPESKLYSIGDYVK